jgi:endonuclease YncB( thermonuclease family)
VWLTDTVLGKVVQCQLLRKDQYGRIVSSEARRLEEMREGG